MARPAKKNMPKRQYKRQGKDYNKSEDQVDPSDTRNSRKFSNDPAWYSIDPNLLRDSSSFPYSWPLGQKIDWKLPVDGTGKKLGFTTSRGYNLPGILTLWTIPSVGPSKDNASALNLASYQLYTYVRHLNSGSSNYDAPDLFLYVLAMSSVYSYINFLQRLYGTVSLYAQKNRYLPEALFAAQGVDYQSVSLNLADFRYRLNLLINKASSFAVPADIAYYKRQAFNFSGLYTEGESIKDQLYLQAPALLYQYGLDADGAGQLNLVQPPFSQYMLTDDAEAPATTEQLFAFADSLINPLLYNEDFGIMNGDILKAYGSDRLIKLVSVDPNYTVFPVFDLKVLEQFKNARVLDAGFGVYNHVPAGVPNQYLGAVMQDSTKGYLVSKTKFTAYAQSKSGLLDLAINQMHSGSQIVSTHAADATPEITVENTRLMFTLSQCDVGFDDTNYFATYEVNSGSDICVAFGITQFNDNMVPGTTWYNTAVHIDFGVQTNATNSAIARKMAQLSNFEFHPMQWFSICNSDNNLNEQVDAPCVPVWNVGNFTVLHPDDIARMNEACLMSLFHVQQIAKLN